jgi:hypothetical protein
LIESNEYGYCSLIKATKQVLDKLELENRTGTKITSKERMDHRLWNPIAVREALINAIVHNDYSNEVPPKFEIFLDRLEITSAGGLTQGLSQSEFFEGYSGPRNKEIMRIYKDLEMVEYLGSGIPRILKFYSKDCFIFSENFLRMVFYISEPLTPEVTSIINVLFGEMSRKEIQKELLLKDEKNFRKNYQQPAIMLGYIEMTIPDKPNSSKQKFRLTEKGLRMQNKF